MTIENALKVSDITAAYYALLRQTLWEIKAEELGVELAPKEMSLRERWVENRKRRADGRPELVPIKRLPELDRLHKAAEEHIEHMRRLESDPAYAARCSARMTAEIMEGYRTSRYHGD